LIEPFLAAELSNAVLATQAFQHDTDLLFSGMMPACGSANIPDCLFSALRYALARLSHRCSSAGYDEPAILSYAISSFCPTRAVGLEWWAAGLVATAEDRLSKGKSRSARRRATLGACKSPAAEGRASIWQVSHSTVPPAAARNFSA